MKRERNFNGTVIPSAARWEAHTCGSCPNVHLIAFNDDNKPFAEVIFDRTSLKGLFIRGNDIIDEMVERSLNSQK